MQYLILSSVAILFYLQPLAGTESISTKIQQANDFFDATLFDEAIPLYEEIWLAIQQKKGVEMSEDEEDFILLRFAQAHFSKHHYLDTISLLSEKFWLPQNRQSINAASREALYTLGLAYKWINDRDSSIKAFDLYLKSGPLDLKFSPFAHYELGMAYFDAGNFQLAKNHLDEVTSDSDSYEWAQLIRAKIEKIEGKLPEAEKTLVNLENRFVQDHLLRYEWLYQCGEVAYLLHNYLKAAEFFEQALPKKNLENAAWHDETHYLLGWCYIKIADDAEKAPDFQLTYFDKAETIFKKAMERKSEERSHLALGQLFLIKGKRLNDKDSLNQAKDILGQTDLFINPENRAHALMLSAEATCSYAEREVLYKLLTQDAYKETSWYPQGWFLRGLCDYEQGALLLEQEHGEEAKRICAQAALSFEKAFHLLKEKDNRQAQQAIKYLVETCCKTETQESYFKAFHFLDDLTKDKSLLDLLDAAEIYYLHGLIASYLAKDKQFEKFSEIAQTSLEQGVAQYLHSPHAEKTLFLLGTVHFYKKEYAEAEKTFLQLTQEFPNSPSTAAAYFYAGKSSEAREPGNEAGREYRKKVFEQFPDSPLAAEAYFFHYSYNDYLQGDRPAIKHLQGMKDKFPESPYTIAALYLIGMNFKKDRKNSDGKWISKKNLNEAIEAFQETESLFDLLYKRQMLPPDDLLYFIKIRYQAILERALANLAIADESQGAKKQIFLEYASEVFAHNVHDFKDPDHPLTKHLCNKEPYPHLLEESTFWLAQSFVKMLDDQKAEKTLWEMVEKYRSAKITRGYVFSRVWYELGLLAMRRQDFVAALQHFDYAADAAKGRLLSTDQRIDLWIQQSLCHKELNEMDKAMILLSKAINDDSISSLRIKAMYIRAEIYAAQGRHELARKQLEATSKKGGEWALKAKQKLDQEYGYQ